MSSLELILDVLGSNIAWLGAWTLLTGVAVTVVGYIIGRIYYRLDME